jgi:hypothetical protein
VHKVKAGGGGFASHLGFVEIHQAFVEACRDGRRLPSDVRDCVDATLIAIVAEQAMKEGGVLEVPRVG